MFTYAWLKILDTLKKRGTRISVGELRTALDARGFHIEEDDLAGDLGKMQGFGLIESNLLLTSSGDASLGLDDSSSIGITTAGLRRLAAIVKI